ncbi:hypothetical protein DRP04_13670 [Archaeoglobales archaeon]|nr:MAG: hypothetical protein DRP04_13670 [Archaeoglobales archaeon]
MTFIDETLKRKIETEIAPRLWKEYGIGVHLYKDIHDNSRYKCMLYKPIEPRPIGDAKILAELLALEHSSNPISIKFGEWDVSPEDMPEGSEMVAIWSATVYHKEEIDEFVEVVQKIEKEYWSKIRKHNEKLKKEKEEQRKKLISYFKSL